MELAFTLVCLILDYTSSQFDNTALPAPKCGDSAKITALHPHLTKLRLKKTRESQGLKCKTEEHQWLNWERPQEDRDLENASEDCPQHL